MTQEKIESRSLRSGIKTFGHNSFDTHLSIVRTATPVTVIITKPRIAAGVTPAIPTARDGLCVQLIALTLTRYGSLRSTMISIVQTAIQMLGTVPITVACGIID